MRSTKRENKIVIGGIFAVVLTLAICLGICAFTVRHREKRQEKQETLVAAAEEQEEADPGFAQEEAETDRKERETLTSPAEETKGPAEKIEGSQEEKREIPQGPLIIETDPSVYTYENMEKDLKDMEALHQEMKVDSLGETMDGREIYHVLIGNPEAPRHVLITGSIHAREYMTTQIVMKQMNEFLKNDQWKETYLGELAIHVVPMINPDGVTISQFGLDGIRKEETKSYITEVIMKQDGSGGGENYFRRWKANAHGVDLNRNFDALWDQYGGSGHPSSDHYKGEAPGSEPEAAALISLTEGFPFVRTVSYHTQGNVIYWYFGQTGDLKTKTERFASQVSAVTGYALDANYQKLDPAGYKDWAISKKEIPSLTIEVGRETSPVPAAQFGEIWNRNSLVWQVICDSALEP